MKPFVDRLLRPGRSSFGLVNTRNQRNMHERRREPRYKLAETTDGEFRISRGIAVQHSNGAEWIAFSREAAAIGKTLLLDIVRADPDFGELHERLPVLVIDSQPVILDGDVRYRIRLQAGELAPVLFEQQVRRG